MAASELIRNGLADANPALVQMLGLCPLLAVSTSVASALGLGLATLAVLALSNCIASITGRWLLPEVRLAVYVVTIAAAVTAVEQVMAAWIPGLYQSLGLFLPLIVTNCLVLARAESFAGRASVARAVIDGIAMGAGFALVLLALGASRELIGRGSLGADLGPLLGEWAAPLGLHVFEERHGLLLALLPPGAFILLALMAALRNWRAQARQAERRR